MMPGAIYRWTFSTATTFPPPHKGLRLNAVPALAVLAWFDNTTADNIEVHDGLLTLPVGTEIAIQSAGDHSQEARFLTTAVADDQSGYVAVPIGFVSQAGTLLDAGAVDVVFYADVEPATPPLEFSHIVVPAPLVSLPVAKDHLRITDTVHDADVTQKLQAAQDLVIAKLGLAADATWTETTVPRPVRHAILIGLDALYERRGGDEANDSLRKALEVIDLLVALYRDPALA